jgi:hypothetical protein
MLNQHTSLDIEWLLCMIREQIHDLIWIAVKEDSNSNQDILKELSAVQKNIEDIKILLALQPVHSNRPEDSCISLG